MRRVFQWDFIQADVKTLIVVAGFQAHYNLSVNMRKWAPLENLTDTQVTGLRTFLNSTGISPASLYHILYLTAWKTQPPPRKAYQNINAQL